MRSVKSVILLFVFAFSLIGYGIQAHFCNGKFTGLSMAGDAFCCSKDDQPDHKKKPCVKHSEDGQCKHHEKQKNNCCKDGCPVSGDCCTVQVFTDISDFDIVKIDWPSFNVPKISAIGNPFLISLFRNSEGHYKFTDPVPPCDRTIRYKALLI